MAQRQKDPLNDSVHFLSSYNVVSHDTEAFTGTICYLPAQLAHLLRDSLTDHGGNQRFVSSGCDEGQGGHCEHIRT